MSGEMTPTSDWSVFVEWTGRGASAKLSRTQIAKRARAVREHASGGFDIADGCFAVDEFFLVAAVIIAVLLAILIGPLLFAIALALIEVVLVVAVVAAIVGWKVAFRRPWRVVAIGPHGETWSWKQIGWRDAHQLVARLYAELSLGADPARLAPGDAVAEGQSASSIPADSVLMEKSWFRMAAWLTTIGLLVGLGVAVLIRFL